MRRILTTTALGIGFALLATSSVLSVSSASSIAIGADAALRSEQTSSSSSHRVRCGADMHGEVATRVPRAWTRTVHRVDRCVWVSPSADQRLVLLTDAAPMRAERRRRVSGSVGEYVEHSWHRARVSGNPGHLWDFGCTPDSRRFRVREVGTHSFRVIYRAKHGTFGAHRHIFVLARHHLALSG
jgi:hypothetical protein